MNLYCRDLEKNIDVVGGIFDETMLSLRSCSGLQISQERSHYIDRLCDDLRQNHNQIHIVDFEFYNMNIFNRCENSNDVLPAIPYGLLHSPQPSEPVKRFLAAVQSAMQ